MRSVRKKGLCLFARVALVSCITAYLQLHGPQAEASVDKARMLYDAGLLEDAKRELIETITSEAADSDKAASLHLLGTIAVDEKRFDTALKTWADLQARFPQSVDAEMVKGKIPLVRALAEQHVQSAGGQGAALENTERLQGVVITGGGAETRYLEQAVDEIAAFLIGNQVVTSKPKNWRAPLTEIAPQAQNAGAHSVLILNIKFGYLESLRAECFLSNGTRQWEEKVSGSMGISGSGVAAGLIKRMKSKLEGRLEDPCFMRKD